MTNNGVRLNLGVSDTERKATIFAIGGGKGGVGKTVIAASLGVGLSMFKKRVVVVDADLGGADLHVAMGIEKPDKTYYNFYNREYSNLDEILIDHPRFENLKIISGANGSLGIANLPSSQKMKFIRHLKKIDADFIILDLGAGTSYNVLDFFLAADQGIAVVNPDPLSILEGYNFIKQALFRQIAQKIRCHNDALEIIRQVARTETHKKSLTVEDLIREVNTVDALLAKEIEFFLGSFRPMILINMKAGYKDENNVLAIKTAARNLLAIDLEYLGAIRKDNTVKKSLDAMTPFMSYDPKSEASRDLANIIITKILHAGKFQFFRARHEMHRKLRQNQDTEKTEVICSFNCLYWEDCGFKNGGYPCDLKHFSTIKSFH